MKIFLIIPALLTLLVTKLTFADDFLCIADLATGFRYNQNIKSWEESSFKLKKSRYFISLREKGTGYDVKRSSGPDVMSRCKDGFDEIGSLSCKGTFDIKFNKINGRFVLTYPFGYFNVIPDSKIDSKLIRKTDQGSETPFMEIGKCSAV
jgi:hypothetical protein